MDKHIQKSKWKNKTVWGTLGLLLLVGIAIFLIKKGQITKQIIDINSLKLAQVSYGGFQEIMVANTILEPEKSVWIDAKDGGNIKQIFVEEGEMVEAGDVLMQLANESVALDLMQRETQMVEQINTMRNIRLTLNQNQRSTLDQFIDFSQQLKLNKHQLKLNQTLLKQAVISDEEFYQTKTQNDYLEQKVRILNTRIKEDSIDREKQVSRIDQSIALMERNLNIIRIKLKEITIVAPISGRLNYFDYEIGQTISRNQNIGRIDNTDRYILRAHIDQHYLSQISEGISGSITLNASKTRLQVFKIFPRIENGQFDVLFEFTSPADSLFNLRRGQNFQIEIELSAQKSALMISKGNFFQSSGGQYVYVLSKDKLTAEKRFVQFGRKNPDVYEIKQGLSEGETVIISNYDSFQDQNLLTLQQ
ncbi:MAG: efflux RND transporter periplasmic adaptor subunit [Flavobacteriales bacterium]